MTFFLHLFSTMRKITYLFFHPLFTLVPKINSWCHIKPNTLTLQTLAPLVVTPHTKKNLLWQKIYFFYSFIFISFFKVIYSLFYFFRQWNFNLCNFWCSTKHYTRLNLFTKFQLTRYKKCLFYHAWTRINRAIKSLKSY